MVQWLFLAVEITYLVLGIMAMIITLKNWKRNKNRILIAISVYIAAILLQSIVDIAVYVADFNIDIVLFGYVTFGQVLGNILFIIQLEFVLFLKKFTKLYTLPIIVSFYIIAGRIIVDSTLPFILYAMIVSYGSAYQLINDGRKRQNGLAIGMGLFFLLWGLGQTIGPNTVGILITFRLFAMITLLLGTLGFYEKYIFPDQYKEEKIMNTWITKLVIKK